MSLISISLLVALLGSAQALVLSPAVPVQALRAPVANVQLARPMTFKMLTEDEEFEEFRRRKLGAVKELGSDENFGSYRRVEGAIYTVGGAITILVPIIAGIWAYNEGYLTPQ